jgi:hypothetical protein
LLRGMWFSASFWVKFWVFSGVTVTMCGTLIVKVLGSDVDCMGFSRCGC